MALTHQAAKVRLADMTCDSCGAGLMRPHGPQPFTVGTPQINHKCNYCGVQAVFDRAYPSTEYVAVGPIMKAHV
jgi:ribosomal protein S27E